MRIAVDPGKTAGVAWRNEDGELRVVQWPGEAIKAVLDGMHAQYELDEVVIENFRSRPGPAVDLSASENIGRVEAWCDNHGIPMVRQEVGAVKRRVTNDRLREVGGWTRGQKHARDATKHLLYREEKVTGVDYWPRRNPK
jgi:hypothetical protein